MQEKPILERRKKAPQTPRGQMASLVPYCLQKRTCPAGQNSSLFAELEEKKKIKKFTKKGVNNWPLAGPESAES